MNLSTLESGIAVIIGLATIVGGWWFGAKYVARFIRDQLAWRRLRIERLEFQMMWMKRYSPFPMFRLDADLNCIWANQALCELLDVDSSELIGKVWFNIIKPQDLETVTLKWQQAVKNKAPYRNVQEMLIDGKYKKTTVTGEPFIYADKVYEFIGTVRLVLEP